MNEIEENRTREFLEIINEVDKVAFLKSKKSKFLKSGWCLLAGFILTLAGGAMVYFTVFFILKERLALASTVGITGLATYIKGAILIGKALKFMNLEMVTSSSEEVER